ncbi:MAG: SDR family oxidoreductase [Thermomicrobiales bacterium]|nr:SDR family oxidoreductase [Thermomicrobiales bacterium]
MSDSGRRYLNLDLGGKVAIVTGASSGIGRAVAEAMAEAGASLVLVGRDERRLQDGLDAVRARGVDAEPVAVELTADDAPATIVDAAIARFGRLDVLVNCAGIFEPQPFETQPLASFDRQMAINVRAPFALAQAALPHLRPGGAIVNMSSIAGYSGFPLSAAYCASKGAVELMTKALAAELGPMGVRVNCVAPGNIRTPMNRHQFEASPEYERSLEAQTPLGRIGETEDIAAAVVYLASPAAKFVNGASWLVDGGWNAA